MQYFTYEHLIRDCMSWASKNPQWHHLRGIVGIPSSGMLPAMILSGRLGVPVASLEDFLSSGGRFPAGMHSGRQPALPATAERSRSILVVDDSVWSGATLGEARRQISSHCGMDALEFTYTAVYGRQGCEYPCYVITSDERLFEWNWLRSSSVEGAMVDMDGLLCEDPPAGMTEEQYASWMQEARPRFLIRRKLRAVVSGRLEKYRKITESWLDKWGISRQEVILLPDEMQGSDHVKHKARHYGLSRARIFIESDHTMAEKISGVTGKAVLCPNDPPEVYGTGIYEPGQVAHIFPFVPPRVEWFLLGGPADGSEASDFLERFPWVKVVGFEPNPMMFSLQTRRNFPGALLPVALWREKAKVKLRTPNSLEGTDGMGYWQNLRSASTVKDFHGAEFEVEADSLDGLSRKYGPFSNAVLWIDIEGSEMECLKGARGLLERGEILAINAEVMADGVAEIADFLGRYGLKEVLRWNHNKDMESGREWWNIIYGRQ